MFLLLLVISQAYLAFLFYGAIRREGLSVVTACHISASNRGTVTMGPHSLHDRLLRQTLTPPRADSAEAEMVN